MSQTAIYIAALVLFLWYLSFTATRLDRLHHRVETSWAALDSLLQRRAAIALEIAHSAMADPGMALILNQAAHQAREADISERSEADHIQARLLAGRAKSIRVANPTEGHDRVV